MSSQSWQADSSQGGRDRDSFGEIDAARSARLMLRADPDSLYAALLARDPAYDGFWFVAARTTGIFCRLTCPARKPKRENVAFYSSACEAEAAGFRGCLRCKPSEPGAQIPALIAELKRRVEIEPDRAWTAAELELEGYEPSTVRRLFKKSYGTTFARYARAQRLSAGLIHLRTGGSVIEAQLESGYESGSGFRDAVTRLAGDAPARVRGRHTLTSTWIDTPLGSMIAVADERALHLLEFTHRKRVSNDLARLQAGHGPLLFAPNPVLDETRRQLAGYFENASNPVELPARQNGDSFCEAVWIILRAIPAGVTRTYSDIAREIGKPGAAHEVGKASDANRIAIAVPCHRAIGASPPGNGGMLWHKRWLLEHEKRGVETGSG